MTIINGKVVGGNGTAVTQISCGGKIHINGKTYENIRGNMVITDKGVFVDGKPIEEYKEPFAVNLTIEGNVESVTSDNCDITVNGEVGSALSKNGNITVKGNVMGNAETKNGNIIVKGDVHGDATTKNGNII